jgi:hypothetical protein
MHGKQVDIPLAPYIKNFPDELYYPLLKNHDMHHKVKGDDKGNYNIVVLGADAILNTKN